MPHRPAASGTQAGCSSSPRLARAGDLAVSTGDPAFADFLRSAGATLSYQPGQKYVTLIAADGRTIDFVIGDTRYTQGGIDMVAAFAPYVEGNDAYVPFFALARALSIDAVPDGDETVLEPQLASLGIRSQGATTSVTLGGGTKLRYEQPVHDDDGRLVIVFRGVASTLEAERRFSNGALRSVSVSVNGTVRNPTTRVEFDTSPGSAYSISPSGSPNVISLVFTAQTSDAADAAAAQVETPAQITGIAVANFDDAGARVDIAAAGDAEYEWHRLTDNRWYIDLEPAVLSVPAQTVSLRSAAVSQVRTKAFIDPSNGQPKVRIAFSLGSARGVAVARSATGVTLRIGDPDPAVPGRSASGLLSSLPSDSVAPVANDPSLPAVAPVEAPSAASAPATSAQPGPSPGRLGGRFEDFKTSQAGDGGVVVDLSMTGNVTYEWHRIDDSRWYVDFKPASLAIRARDVPLQSSTPLSMRLKAFVGPKDGQPTVRVAFEMESPLAVALEPAADGVSLHVGGSGDSTAQSSGYGNVFDGNVVASAARQSVPPAAVANGLIVIDPGHGGSDSGASHNGLVEKDLTLDISDRLRDVLVSRGWTVEMTRTSDVDVYAPNDSAHDELQARCDVANRLHARLFVSIHVNSFTSSGQHGTTTYFYKADSLGFARAVHERLATALPTADDGVLKANYYVIHHTVMPAILVETAFVSNPSDAQLLRSEQFRQRVAIGIADGVGDYVSAPPPAGSDSGGQSVPNE